jgi:hypothetical protein
MTDHFRIWKLYDGVESTVQVEHVTLERRNTSSEAGVKEEEDGVDFE